jgi:hypothetical protein
VWGDVLKKVKGSTVEKREVILIFDWIV